MVTLVESKVELRRAGPNSYFGCCPFHEDKTPSLVVSESKNLWHCLGACQAGGSVIIAKRADGRDILGANATLLRGFPQYRWATNFTPRSPA